MSNVSLAKHHRASRKLVGHSIALASYIAILLSGLVIAAGVVTYAVMTFDLSRGYWVIAYWVLGLVIGTLLAILIESLTLGSCARLRHTLEVRKEIRKRYAKLLTPTNEVLLAEKSELKETGFTVSSSIVFIVLGVSISTIAATLMWHLILSPLGDAQSWLYSTLFSSIVSLSLLVSELAKSLNTAVIAESIHADNFVPQAVREDSKEKVLDELEKDHKTHIIEAMDTDAVQNEVILHAAQIVAETLTGNTERIPLLISREKEMKRLQIEQERQTTNSQLRLVKGARDIEEPITEELQGTSDSPRRDGERNYQIILGLYNTLGEAYIKDHIEELAKQHNVSERTIYRHIDAIKKEQNSMNA